MREKIFEGGAERGFQVFLSTQLLNLGSSSIGFYFIILYTLSIHYIIFHV